MNSFVRLFSIGLLLSFTLAACQSSQNDSVGDPISLSQTTSLTAGTSTGDSVPTAGNLTDGTSTAGSTTGSTTGTTSGATTSSTPPTPVQPLDVTQQLLFLKLDQLVAFGGSPTIFQAKDSSTMTGASGRTFLCTNDTSAVTPSLPFCPGIVTNSHITFTDARDRCMTLSGGSKTDLRLAPPFSIGARVRMENLPENNAGTEMRTIISRYKSTGSNREWVFGIRQKSTGSTWHAAFLKAPQVDDPSTTTINENQNVEVFLSKTPLVAGNWFNIVFVMETNGAWKYYVNGVDDTPAGASPTNFPNFVSRDTNAQVGCVTSSTVSPDYFFKEGGFKEVRVFKRALTETEISQHFSTP